MDVSSIALQGLEQAQARVETTATRLAGAGAGSPDGTGGDSVDLSEEMISLLTARNQFASNTDVLKVADNMRKSMINLLG